MQPTWLVESAGLWGFHGRMISNARQPFAVEAVHEYWLSNKCRFDAWNSLLTNLSPRLRSSNTARRTIAWSKLSSLVQEILLAEPLSRMCVSVALHLEERGIDTDARPVLHNVFQAHQEVRQRALGWILEGVENGEEAATQLNRLRSYLEHWTDMLLGFFATSSSVVEYAFSADRVSEFAEEYGLNHLGGAADTVWTLLLTGNRKWIATHCNTKFVFPKLNQRVCHSALAMVNQAWFDSLGVLPRRATSSINNNMDFVDRAVGSLVDGSWLQLSTIGSAAPSPRLASRRK